MNKELLKLQKLLKTFNSVGLTIDDVILLGLQEFKEEDKITVEDLIDIMEDDMTYWER